MVEWIERVLGVVCKASSSTIQHAAKRLAVPQNRVKTAATGGKAFSQPVSSLLVPACFA